MKSATGTTPHGTSDEQQAARWVQGMFAKVAPRYDFLNHLLSFNIDRGWRKALLRRLQPVLLRKDARILDLCCGTGDVLLELKEHTEAHVYGADFCYPMLHAAAEKAQHKHVPAPVFQADGLQMPVAAAAFDAVAIAFGFRNFANYTTALHELFRILNSGGVLAILEFSHPRGALINRAYRLYSHYILPVIGSVVSGSADAYTYLPDSIAKFPSAEALQRMMEDAGFRDTSFELLTGGIAALHSGVKR